MQFLERYGYFLVFGTALIEQLGMPVPAAPVLLAAGALAASGGLSAALAILLASTAAVVADSVWYSLGRRRGTPVLALLCRISLEADSCVSRTQAVFRKLGSAALLVAKFVPGLSTVAPPLAGITRMPLWRFLLLDLCGSALWSGVYVFLGFVFSHQLEQVGETAVRFGAYAGITLAALLGFYVAVKFRQRHRFIGSLRTMRIEPQELLEMMRSDVPPAVIDLRLSEDLPDGATQIAGAIRFPKTELESRHGEIPRDRDVVLYCSCPNEASSATMALALHKRGITRVRPLRGGFEEWTALGYPVEPVAA